MSRAPRFFVEPASLEEGEVDLPEEEARHARKSRRLKAGDAAELFDGAGRVGEGEIVAAEGRRVVVRVDRVRAEPPPGVRIELATAVPKAKRWQMLVEKATELGVDRIVPIHFRHTVAEGAGDRARWRRWVIEACKQSRRARLVELEAPRPLNAWLAAPAPRTRRLLAAPEGGTAARLLSATPRARHPDTAWLAVLVGPEAGLTPEEVAACERAGLERLRLGPHILRIETAALGAVALLRAGTDNPAPEDENGPSAAPAAGEEGEDRQSDSF
jgi:16S rRNA (uracil1498-N3)-methyltransferase